MNNYEILLVVMGVTLFGVMLVLAIVECIREMHARTVKDLRAAQTKKLYVEDLRRDRT